MKIRAKLIKIWKTDENPATLKEQLIQNVWQITIFNFDFDKSWINKDGDTTYI